MLRNLVVDLFAEDGSTVIHRGKHCRNDQMRIHAVLHLLDDDGGDIGVLVQVVIDLFLHKVTNELIDGNASLGSRCQ